MLGKNLEMALFLDKKRNSLAGVDYIHDWATKEEMITITFLGGSTKNILATGNSNGANAKAIIDAIYS